MRLRRVSAVGKKNIRIYYAKGPVILFGILVPAFFFLAFTLGREMSDVQLASGLLGMALWFTATSVSPVITPWETRDGTLERLISAPITVAEILLGDVLASAAVGMAITSLAAVVLFTFLGLTVSHPVVLLLGLVLSALGFSALGVVMATIPTDQTSDVMMLATLVKFPVIFVSGIFIPVENLPTWGRVVAYASPLTYLVQVTRYGLGSGSEMVIWLFGLLLFFLISLIIAIQLHRRTLPARL